MTDDLYEVLGVSRDATRDEIREAYRKKANILHPDKGGGGEEMARVNAAWSVLGDPAKRRAYDHGSDTVEETAISLLAEMMAAALHEAEQMEPGTMWVEDLIDVFRQQCLTSIEDTRRSIKLQRRKLVVIEDLADRFTVREGVNRMAQAARSRINEIETGIRRGEAAIAVREAALELLDGYTFRVDEANIQPRGWQVFLVAKST